VAATTIAADGSTITDVCADRQGQPGNFATATTNAAKPTVKLIDDTRAKRTGQKKTKIQRSVSSCNRPALNPNNNRMTIGIKPSEKDQRRGGDRQA
jgi:hypothetical protein